MGTLRQLTTRGEVKEFSHMYNHTRHLALERLEQDARERGCNSVVDVTTRIMPFGPGVREMLMVGTGSYNPALGDPKIPVTSELTGEELWNLTELGFAPLRLVLGTSVYALGLAGGLKTFFRSFGRGEMDDVTRLIYEARENCLEHIERDAKAHDADGVIGTKVFVYEMGAGLVEVLAIGTAIKRNKQVRTETEQLLTQAVIRDRETFFDDVTFRKHSAGDGTAASGTGHTQAGAGPTNAGGAVLLVGCFVIVAVVLIGIAVTAFLLHLFNIK